MPTFDRTKYLYTAHLITPLGQQHLIDQKETPEGYKAIPKDTLNTTDNICNHCDWRKECQKNASVSCMSYSRKDGIGVLFKKEAKLVVQL